ncbi:MAG: tetratricopeptide repeat protein [Candidatus Hodarchaeota archaeon]
MKTDNHHNELELIGQLVQRGDLDKAVDKLEPWKNKRKWEKNAWIQSQILRVNILILEEKHEEALTLIEEVIIECNQEKNKLLIIDCFITKATVLFETNQLEICLKLLHNTEKMLHMNKKETSEIEGRFANIYYIEGKVYRKKGEFEKALVYLKKCISLMEKLEKEYELADPFNVIGIIYDIKGQHDLALNYFNRSLDLFEEIGNKRSILKLFNNIGMNRWRIGNLNEALTYFKKSLDLSEELGNKRFIAHNRLNIGLIYRYNRDFSTALEHFQKSLEIFEKLDSKWEMATCYNNIGMIFYIRGDFDSSMQFYQKGLEIGEEQGHKEEVARILSNMGEIYHDKSEYEKALISFNKSLEIFEEIGSNVNSCLPLFNLVVVSIDIGSVKTAEKYLDKLRRINEYEENKWISQKYRVAYARMLKTGERITKKAEAQKIFHEILDEETIDIGITVMVMLNLCDLLIEELRLSGSEEVVKEVKDLLKKLHEFAHDQQSYLWLAQVYWLQSKLALMELNIGRAETLLSQAQTLAEEKGLQSLANIISNDYASLIEQSNRWQKFVEEQPTMTEIIEFTQLENLLERMIQKKLYRKDEDVLQYAEKARILAKRWEESM